MQNITENTAYIYRGGEEILRIPAPERKPGIRWGLDYDTDANEKKIELSSEIDEYLSLKKGDIVFYYDEKYYLNRDYIPEINEETGGYKYELVFYSIETRFYDFLVKLDGKTDFNYNATASDHLKLMADNIRGNGLDDFSFWTDITEFKNIHYKNLSIHNALDLIANTYEGEWWLDEELNLIKSDYNLPVRWIGHSELIMSRDRKMQDTIDRPRRMSIAVVSQRDRKTQHPQKNSK